jgi:hypothetical protein
MSLTEQLDAHLPLQRVGVDELQVNLAGAQFEDGFLCPADNQ